MRADSDFLFMRRLINTMSKRILALLLCVVMLVPCFAGCNKKAEGDLGAYITMYLTDEIFDFDPANAYFNQNAINVVSMLFDTLFTLSDSGKVQKSLVKSYKVKEDQKTGDHYMDITLNEAYWSNGIRLSSEDIVFAWKRLLKFTNNYEAASLLYDIKNARAVKEGDETVDDIGIEAVAIDMVRITFEGEIDYDRFLLNLTSVATAPLLETYVSKNEDWAKKPALMATSGAYKLGKINYKEVLDENGKEVKFRDDNAVNKYGEVGTKNSLVKDINYFYLERNVYYYRDTERDAIDKSVSSYRILVDCSKSDEEILADYKDGKIFYMGTIPMSLRDDAFVKENVKISNALSTFTLYLNQNALIDNDGDEETPGEALFANEKVRQALSLAIDREAIAKAVVYADAATGLVCPGVFEGNKYSKKNDFRTVGGALLETSANISAAKSLLNGIDTSKYSFSIAVASYDEENVAIVELVAEAWRELGFNVTVDKRVAIANNDAHKELIGSQNDTPEDVCDDLFIEAYKRGTYEVIAFDYNAFSADAYSMLSNFALSFSGMALTIGQDENGHPTYSSTPNSTGYNNEEYNKLLEAAYYLPYFAAFTEEQLADENFTFLSIYDTHDEFMETYNMVKAVYEANGITPSTKKSDWSKQRALLLHKAEELLMTDLPIIPVVFNKNAVIVSKDLKGVSSNYYVPALFRKTTLKNYTDYTFINERGETTSIFAEFPTIHWDKQGESFETEAPKKDKK
ncbi:MAG: hypothetical protein E7666_01655 [Ruminococcaceae bacterium]|nr:hypothetical protein [Oscillospiraceae bacterium]